MAAADDKPRTTEDAAAAATVAEAWRVIEEQQAVLFSAADAGMAPPSALRPRKEWREVRLFVSSTFADMHYEREVLLKQVLPRLKTWGEERRLRIVEVDLRWGVPKDSTSETVFRTCLGELDRCREVNGMPFFLNLLSNRYGWAPDFKDVPPGVAADYNWVPGVSITHMEILHGAYRLRNPNAAFFFRDPSYLTDLPEEFRSQFVDADPVAAEALRVLKDKLRAMFPKQTLDYTCKPGEVDTSSGIRKLKLDGLESFGEAVFEFFTAAMERQYPLSDEPLSLGERLAGPHEDFVQLQEQFVLGRTDESNTLLDKLVAPPATTLRPGVVFVAPSGAGKSAFLSHVAATARRRELLTFFHTTSCGGASADATSIARRLVLELATPELAKKAEDETLSWLAVENLFRELIGSPETNLRCFPQPCVIILDGVQALTLQDSKDPLNWFPNALHPCFGLVMSCQEGVYSRHLEKRLVKFKPEDKEEAMPLEMRELPMLVKEWRARVVENKLGHFNKKLDPVQLDSLTSNKGSENMLWLALACEELRVFGVFETVTKFIQELPPTLKELLRAVMDRIKGNDVTEGKAEETLRLIAASQNGLAEEELQQLLGTVDDQTNELQPLPMAKWALIFASIRPFVRNQGGEGVGHLVIVSDSVCEMITGVDVARYNAAAQMKPYHKNLADFFERHPSRKRRVEELPAHLLALMDKKRLAAYVRSPEAKFINQTFIQTLTNRIRCLARLHPIPGQTIEPEQMCMACAPKFTLSPRWPNRMACACCGASIFSTANMQPGKPYKPAHGETLAMSCRQHNPMAHQPNAKSFMKCAICKRAMPKGSPSMPCVTCRICSMGMPTRCCCLE